MAGAIQARVNELHSALSNPVTRPSLSLLAPQSPNDTVGVHVLAALGDRTAFQLATVTNRIHRDHQLMTDLRQLSHALDLWNVNDVETLGARMLTLFDGMAAPDANVASPVPLGEERDGWTALLNPQYERFRLGISRLPGVAEARAGIFSVFDRPEKELGIRVELNSLEDLPRVKSALRFDSGFGAPYESLGVPIALYLQGEQLYALDGAGKIHEPRLIQLPDQPIRAEMLPGFVPAPRRQPNADEIRRARNEIVKMATGLRTVIGVKVGHFRLPASDSNPLEVRFHVSAQADPRELSQLLRPYLYSGVPVEVLHDGWRLYYQDGNGYVYDPPVHNGKPDRAATSSVMRHEIAGDVD